MLAIGSCWIWRLTHSGLCMTICTRFGKWESSKFCGIERTILSKFELVMRERSNKYSRIERTRTSNFVFALRTTSNKLLKTEKSWFRIFENENMKQQTFKARVVMIPEYMLALELGYRHICSLHLQCLFFVTLRTLLSRLLQLSHLSNCAWLVVRCSAFSMIKSEVCSCRINSCFTAVLFCAVVSVRTCVHGSGSARGLRGACSVLSWVSLFWSWV